MPQHELVKLTQAQTLVYSAQKQLAEAARLCGQGAEHYELSTQLADISLELIVTESRVRHAMKSEKRLDIG